MENTTAITSMSMQTTPVVAAPSPSRMNGDAIHGLGVVQRVIGLLTLALGISATVGLRTSYLLTENERGIWGGLVILLTGFIGVYSASYPNSGKWNGIHMAFCLVSCVLAIVDGCFFAIGFGVFNNCVSHNSYDLYSNHTYQYSYRDEYCKDNRNVKVALGIYGTLVTLMAIEFFVAIVAAIYCCKALHQCCGGPSSEGVTIVHQQRQSLMSSSTDQADTTTSDNPEELVQ